MDASSEVCSYVDKSLMNEDATNKYTECPQEGGKLGSMFMYDLNQAPKTMKHPDRKMEEEKKCHLPLMM